MILQKNKIVITSFLATLLFMSCDINKYLDDQKDIVESQKLLIVRQDSILNEISYEAEPKKTVRESKLSEECDISDDIIKNKLLTYKMARRGSGHGTPVKEEQIVHIEPYYSENKKTAEYIVVTLEILHEKINNKRKQIINSRIYHSGYVNKNGRVIRDTIHTLNELYLSRPTAEECWDWDVSITHKPWKRGMPYKFLKSDTLDYTRPNRRNRIRSKDILDIHYSKPDLSNHRICRVFVD